jgi:hypothetical protein
VLATALWIIFLNLEKIDFGVVAPGCGAPQVNTVASLHREVMHCGKGSWRACLARCAAAVSGRIAAPFAATHLRGECQVRFEGIETELGKTGPLRRAGFLLPFVGAKFVACAAHHHVYCGHKASF